MVGRPPFGGNTYRTLDALQTWTSAAQETALDPGLPIVDSHHHLWDDDRGRYLLDEFAADTATGHNVVASVCVEANSMYRADGPEELKPVGEAEFISGLSAIGASGRYGRSRLCAGIVGRADLARGSGIKRVLEALIAAGNGRLRGIRYSMVRDAGDAGKFVRRQVPPNEMFDRQFRDGLACLEPLDLTFDASLFYPQLPDLVDLLKAFPQTTVVLDHCGGLLGVPPHCDRPQVFRTWRSYLQRLSRCPNLSIKIGGLGMLWCGWDFHLRPVPPNSAEIAAAWRPYVETCIECFGTDRCMTESNFPIDKQSCSYAALWNAMQRITEHCSDSEKQALYSLTATRIYRLKGTPELST